MNSFNALPVNGMYFGRSIEDQKRRYRPSPGLIHAANTALALGRPLLITGEPGVGKTDFAFAAAHKLTPDEPLLECYVRSETQAKDLLYTYDSVARFGDAYLQTGAYRDPRNYIKLCGLGEALESKTQRVVLIDEIDKAPRDLPNDLLRELDQGCFEIKELVAEPTESTSSNPTLRREMGRRHRPIPERPFVILTSNEERILPQAFLRRCIYFHIDFPSAEQLNAIVNDVLLQYTPPSSGAVSTNHSDNEAVWPPKEGIQKAVTAFMRLRADTRIQKKPAVSELLEWCVSLCFLGMDTAHTSASPPGPQNLAEAADKVPTAKGGSWLEVPRLMCLVKTLDDRKALGLSV